MSTRSLMRLAALVVFATVMACQTPRTQILVRLDTDMAVGRGRVLTAVQVRVLSRGDMVPRLDRTVRFDDADGGAAVGLPLDLLTLSALVDDVNKEVTVEVIALHDDVALFSQRASSRFLHGTTVLLEIYLADHCRYQYRNCPETQTCGRNGCEPVARQELTPWDNQPPVSTLDAGPCGPSAVSCGDQCADLASDTDNCGACARSCTGHECNAGVCGTECAVGRANCDSNDANGCEVNTRNTINNCGMCGHTCATTHGTVVCANSACVATCDDGYVSNPMGVCEPDIPSPRPISPMSGATVSRHQPTLRWRNSGGVTDVVVEICSDRACTRIVETQNVSGETATVMQGLPPGVAYWRLRGRRNTLIGIASPVWEFVVGARSAPANGSSGALADFDGNGRADLAVGAPNARGRGRVDVFLSAEAGFPAAPTVTLWASNTMANASFGRPTFALGDVNGDGYVDLGVGAPTQSTNAGALYVYPGSATGPAADPTTTLLGPPMPGMFGLVMAGGDFNGDGYADAAIAAPNRESNSGGVYVYYGSRTGLPAEADLIIAGAQGSRLGFNVTAGDFDNDGFADLVAAAPSLDNGAGRLLIYRGSASGLAAQASSFLTSGDGANTFLGAGLANAGDINGDGYDDVVSQPQNYMGGLLHIHVFLGGAQGLLDANASTLDLPGSGTLGFALAGHGDIDGDGYADVLIGTPFAGSGAGRAVALFGGDMGLTVASLAPIAPSAAISGRFGAAVSIIGDTDNNGLAEFVVGAPYAGTDMVGAAAVFSGSGTRTFDAAMAVVRLGADASGNFGGYIAGRTPRARGSVVAARRRGGRGRSTPHERPNAPTS